MIPAEPRRQQVSKSRSGEQSGFKAGVGNDFRPFVSCNMRKVIVGTIRSVHVSARSGQRWFLIDARLDGEGKFIGHDLTALEGEPVLGAMCQFSPLPPVPGARL